MGRTHRLPLVLVLTLLPGLVRAEPDPRTLALVGAKIRTMTDAGDFVGTVVVKGGTIVAVGPNVEVPADAVKIDLTGCVLTPGLIDAHGTVGLNPVAAREGGREAALDILDAVDVFAEDWRDAARQGVTAVYVQPAGSGSLGGSGAVLRVGPATSVEELALRKQAGVQMTMGLAPTAGPQTTNALTELLARRGITIPIPAAPTAPPPQNSLTRFAQYEQLRTQFDAAKTYGASKAPRREPPKELLLRAIEGKIPVRVEVHHEDDVANALRLARDFGLRLVFDHIDRAKVLPVGFTSGRSGLVIGPYASGKPSGEIKTLALDGRRFAIGTFGDDARATAGLRMHAANVVAGGFPRDRVLKALTADAADLLGVGETCGRIAVGRPADLVAFAGDPLDPSVPVRLTLARGTITHDDAKVEVAEAAATGKAIVPDTLPPNFAIRTKRLLQPSGEYAPGELLVVGGRVTDRVGGESPGPIFDVGDAPVTPGLVAGNLTVNDETAADADSAHLRAVDGLAPDDGRLRAYRDGGFLTVVVAPGSSNVLAGVVSAVRPAGSDAPTDIGLKIVLSSSARSRDRYPVSLAGQVELIARRLGGEPATTELYLPPAVATALLAEREKALAAVRGRQTVAFVEAQTRAEIRAGLRSIALNKLRGVLVASKPVAGLAEEVGQSGVAVVIGALKPTDPPTATDESIALSKAGVPLAFGNETADARASVAWLVNRGMARAAARKALTGGAAEALGLPAGSGRLSPGDAADFVVWDGDPLDPTSKPVAVVAQGKRVTGK